MQNSTLINEQAYYRSIFRIFTTQSNELKFYTRNQNLIIEDTVAFDAKAESLSSLELFIASFISSYLLTIKKESKKKEIVLEEIEVSLNCTIKNPLELLNVIGYEEESRLEAIEGKIYVYTENEKEEIEKLCETALRNDFIYKLLKPQLQIHIEPQIFQI